MRSWRLAFFFAMEPHSFLTASHTPTVDRVEGVTRVCLRSREAEADRRVAAGWLLVMTAAWLATVVSASPARAQLVSAPASASWSIDQEPAGESRIPRWLDNLAVLMTLEGELRWMRYRNVDVAESASVSDLYLRRIEAALDGRLEDWVTSIVVLSSEYIEDGVKQGDGTIRLDEAHIDLQRSGFPLYLVVGKRSLPSGLFENFLITDPTIEDAYEVEAFGLTAGGTGSLGADVAATLYKGDKQLGHLFGAGLFGTDSVRRDVGEPERHVGSIVLSGRVTPLPHRLLVFGSYLNEPGQGRRNSTLDGGLNITVPVGDSAAIVVNAEYVKALTRENYAELDRAFEDGAFSLTAAYSFLYREREEFGGGNLRGRRSHFESHPITVTMRYEHFDDGGLTARVATWSLADRYSIGGRLALYVLEDTSLYTAAEFRYSRIRAAAALESITHQRNYEIYLRLGIIY